MISLFVNSKEIIIITTTNITLDKVIKPDGHDTTVASIQIEEPAVITVAKEPAGMAENELRTMGVETQETTAQKSPYDALPFGSVTQSNDPFGLGGQGLSIDQPKFAKEVHIRIFKRNGRQCCTTVSLEALPSLQAAPKPFISQCSKKFSCNGSFNKKDNLIKFSGDVRKELTDCLIEKGLAKKDMIKIHGF